MSKQISLKNMLAEAFFYDVSTEKNQFEASVAGATEQAKKKFEESMKQKVINQKVKVRASRGQPGQPEKDYVIEKVTSASIDWYWKQYVVVFKDEKNKEYFLKPGFKVEVLTAAQPGQQPTAQTPAEPAKKAAAPQAPPAPAAPKANAAASAPNPAGQKNATKAPVAENDDGDCPECGGAGFTKSEDGDISCGTCKDKQTQQADGEGKPPVAEAQQEYKKEWAAQIVGEILFKFLSQQKQNDPNVQRDPARAVLPYIKSSKWVSGGQGNADESDSAEWLLEVPIEDMDPALDPQELKLDLTTELRSSGGAGQQFTRGSADVQKVGRFYRITIDYSVGLDV